MKEVVFFASAAVQWAKLSLDVRRRIDRKLIAYARSGQGDLKRLKGRDGIRLRIGDWRVIFYEESTRIVVVAVGHRREIYD